MKKILLALALMASFTIARAQQQVKTVAAAKAEAEAAQTAADDPKKAAKVATWLKLGQAYMNAFYAPQRNGWIGASETELNVVMAKEKVLKTSKVTLQGTEYTKKQYNTVNYYFTPSGQLEIMEVTKPIYRDVLDRALKAYSKAYELDVKHSKDKQIREAVKTISEKYVDDAFNAYRFDRFKEASNLFEAAANASLVKPFEQLDTNSLYNAGLTAYFAAAAAKGDDFIRSDHTFTSFRYVDNAKISILIIAPTATNHSLSCNDTV